MRLASEMFETSEEAFDQIACRVETAIELAWGKAIGAGRDNRLGAHGFDLRYLLKNWWSGSCGA